LASRSRDCVQRVGVEWALWWVSSIGGEGSGLADEIQEVRLGMRLKQDCWFIVTIVVRAGAARPNRLRRGYAT
jgi:hypothetical protein